MNLRDSQCGPAILVMSNRYKPTLGSRIDLLKLHPSIGNCMCSHRRSLRNLCFRLKISFPNYNQHDHVTPSTLSPPTQRHQHQSDLHTRRTTRRTQIDAPHDAPRDAAPTSPAWRSRGGSVEVSRSAPPRGAWPSSWPPRSRTGAVRMERGGAQSRL